MTSLHYFTRSLPNTSKKVKKIQCASSEGDRRPLTRCCQTSSRQPITGKRPSTSSSCALCSLRVIRSSVLKEAARNVRILEQRYVNMYASQSQTTIELEKFTCFTFSAGCAGRRCAGQSAGDSFSSPEYWNRGK